MEIVLRLAALAVLLAAAMTLVKPRSGWGRLLLFIPKLFAGSRILFIGLSGFLCAAAGWLAARDLITVILGAASGLFGIRHIMRIRHAALAAAREMDGAGMIAQYLSAGSWLHSPWVLHWKPPESCIQRKDINLTPIHPSSSRLLADLWLPAEPAVRSSLGIIYLHGSGWFYADKDFGTRPLFRHLARQGHVVLDLAYTLAPKGDLFRMMEDIRDAIRWMRSHAPELGINPSGIVLMGSSAGGQLALLAAYTSTNPAFSPASAGEQAGICGVISCYGPPDLHAQYERFRELPALDRGSGLQRMVKRILEARTGFEVLSVHGLLPGLLGGTPQEVSDLYTLGSPLSHIHAPMPPTLLLQGEHDFSGIVPEVIKLHRLLMESRKESHLLLFPETEHGYDLYRPAWSPAAQAEIYVLERFLVLLMTRLQQ